MARISKMSGFLKHLIIVFWICFLILSQIVIYTYCPKRISGSSMEPTIHDNTYVFCSKMVKQMNGISRGDIITAKVNIKGKYTPVVKRVIGIPGDKITVDDGIVFINDMITYEEYLDTDTYTDGNVSVILKTGQYFIMGDNREDSVDSRDYSIGVISEEDIESIVIKY